MRFGFFDQLPCPPGFTEQQRFQDIIAQIELGDRAARRPAPNASRA